MSTFVADLEALGGDEDARAENEMAALDDAEEAEESEAPEQSAPSAAGAAAAATVGRRAKGVPSRPGAEFSLYVSGDAQSLKPCGYADPGAFTVGKICASLSEAEVREQLHVFFQEAAAQAEAEGNEMAAIRLAAATPHSFRATCVGWAARSGSSNAFNEARLAGRWKFSSKVFLVYWRLGMQISREFVGSGDQDQIHDFKPWPAGGTTNSLSQDTSSFSGADPNADAGDVNVRKRKARSEDEKACKRRESIKKGKKSVEAELRKNTDARARTVMETGAEEEDDDEE